MFLIYTQSYTTKLGCWWWTWKLKMFTLRPPRPSTSTTLYYTIQLTLFWIKLHITDYYYYIIPTKTFPEGRHIFGNDGGLPLLRAALHDARAHPPWSLQLSGLSSRASRLLEKPNSDVARSLADTRNLPQQKVSSVSSFNRSVRRRDWVIRNSIRPRSRFRATFRFSAIASSRVTVSAFTWSIQNLRLASLLISTTRERSSTFSEPSWGIPSTMSLAARIVCSYAMRSIFHATACSVWVKRFGSSCSLAVTCFSCISSWRTSRLGWLSSTNIKTVFQLYTLECMRWAFFR